MAFKDNILYLRTKAGLSQSELAEKCGVTQQAVYGYEIGVKQPRLEVLAALAKALGCTIDQLVSDNLVTK